jgi:hypothetical protein
MSMVNGANHVSVLTASMMLLRVSVCRSQWLAAPLKPLEDLGA